MEMTETLSECALKVRERECQVRMRLRNHIRKCVRVFVAEYGAQIEKCGHVLITTYKHMCCAFDSIYGNMGVALCEEIWVCF